MTTGHLLIFWPLLAMLIIAAAADLRRRRIPDAVALAIALTGIMQSLTPCATTSPWQAVLGMLAGFGLTAALFAIGALGGGDVKLLAASGAWLGAALTFQVFLAAAVLGMALVVAQCAWRGNLRRLCRNSGMILLNLIHLNELGVEHATATGEACRTSATALPYAVPILAGAALLIATGGPW